MNHQQFPSDSRVWWLVLGIICLVIVLVAYGRLYLGMHTPIDVYAGIPIGLCLLMFWCCVDDHIDQFVTEGENVLPFWTSMSFLVLFAYPRPEYKTPSFEFHTAFNGVVLGVVYGSHRFYSYGQTTALSISTLQDTLNLILMSSDFQAVIGVGPGVVEEAAKPDGLFACGTSLRLTAGAGNDALLLAANCIVKAKQYSQSQPSKLDSWP
ncbi:uncharacterized protein LOC112342719 [Selaginella moellendorffii]|uniref:uncharacterized protein LOC112342719 n=1 Tax=Selaginella moellendorffii TaxID=88036 RepID=UPI000D1C21BC|nr:uncharacterized protein LOC112342719 [Selaginella moellendorffii]|eukprot:XP_024520715.1 uncharacterized protein LOC112342719 [Selaginella moellendorffii]